MKSGFIMIISLVTLAAVSAGEELVIVDSGRPAAFIVVEKDAPANTRLAVDDLVYHIKRASGTVLNINSSAEAKNLPVTLSQKVYSVIMFGFVNKYWERGKVRLV